MPFMAKWIRKVKKDLTALRVGIPLEVVQELGWSDCNYVTVEIYKGKSILIRRLLGDGTKDSDLRINSDGVDRSS